MKIGFLALSGLRAHDRGLLELGMSLPAVVERSRIVSAMPSLGLLYLAAVTPAEHEVRYFEARDASELPAAAFDWDLVALSTLTAQAFIAYEVADRLRRAGVTVVIGGLHASVCPEEALNHADIVVVGEGEQVWPAILATSPERRKGIWRASDFPPVEVARLPIPRYDLLELDRYQRFPVQTSRGCPWRCDFCASSVMLQQKYRRREISGIVQDIEFIKTLRRRPFIEFADDNTFVDKAWGRKLCEALKPLRIKWFTETDVSVADDPALLHLMREAGCRQVLIGLESPDATPLEGIEMRANFKAAKWTSYREAIARIQAHGITVNGCFVLGLDGQDTGIFQRILDFVNETNLFEVQLTVLTAFPGTPLYTRLLGEGRILEPNRWDLCTLFDINFRPQQMTTTQLRDGLYWLAEQIYSPASVHRRREHFLRQSFVTRAGKGDGGHFAI